jgi:rare lipoprotein A
MRWIFLSILFGSAFWLVWSDKLHFFEHTQKEWRIENGTKKLSIHLVDDGVDFEAQTNTKTITDFLKEQHIDIKDGDIVSESGEMRLLNGKKIIIQRRKTITLLLNGEKSKIQTLQTNLELMLAENHLFVGEDDMVLLRYGGSVVDKDTVELVRVVIREEVQETPIPFEKEVNEDDTLSFRQTKVLQKGVAGIEKSIYRVRLYNGKKESRTLLHKERIREPVTEKTVQGKKVVVGKSHTGLGSWYAFTGTLAAASPWLPLGSFVQVTNQENGKQVRVKINDRGPFGKNRILDLDKVAFEKIASLGAGIIPVKVEEIIN